MSDQIFENPRLVSVYDFFDGERVDLIHYLSIAEEFKASTVIDIGSGTGCLAKLLIDRGFSVIGVEPAFASLDFAKRKIGSNGSITWVQGDSSSLGRSIGNLAFMTGNVAQVFLEDDDWLKNLRAIRHALKPMGILVFEVRIPGKKAWLDWNKEKTYKYLNIPDIGEVESWCEITDVTNQLVSFRWTYHFKSTKEIISSDSTLRFRERVEIEESLSKSGFKVLQVRDAPDRPGKEFVFIAKRLEVENSN